MNDKINEIVKKVYAEAETVVINVAGAYLLEVLSDQIDSEKISVEYQKLYNAFDVHNRNCNQEKVIIFHRVFLYKTSGDQFKVDGTIHTKESGYSNDGIFTVTLSANDAYLRLAEIDVQAHQYGAPRPVIIRGVVFKTLDGLNDIDEKHTRFQELEFGGVNCRIKKIERKGTGSYILNIFVAD